MMLSSKLRTLRQQADLPQRKIAAALDIDTATYCKIEKGNYSPRRNQVVSLANILHADEKELITLWLADQVYGIVEYEQTANDVLNMVAENIIEYKKAK